MVLSLGPMEDLLYEVESVRRFVGLRLTEAWPHLLVRTMLAEQLWRAASILSGHPYHRG